MSSHSTDYALGKDCIMHGYMLKLGNPFLTQWQRRYFYLFPNRVEWRGEGDTRVSGHPWVGGGGVVGLVVFVVCVCASGGTRSGWVSDGGREGGSESVS